jgi:hypothetical protein
MPKSLENGVRSFFGTASDTARPEQETTFYSKERRGAPK